MSCAPRLLLFALLAAPSARADAPIPGDERLTPASDDATTKPKPKTPKEQIDESCKGDAATVSIADKKGGDRKKDADGALLTIATPAWRDETPTGQTLTLERGRRTPKECRARMTRLEREFPGRVTFEPTTAERLAEVRERRDKMIPKALTLAPGDGVAAAGVFDGGANTLSGAFTTGVTANGTGLTSAGTGGGLDLRPSVTQANYALPSNQLPTMRTRALNPPAPAFTSAPSIMSTIRGTWDAGSTWVSSRMSDAGDAIGGYAREVRNGFFSGIEMLSGTGYKMVKAFRDSNWGVKPLVRGLQRVFAYMKGNGLAETNVAIGDISSRNGGRIGGHLSHQRGRDVDIGFYIVDSAGKPVEAQEFVKFVSGRDGLSGNYNGKVVRFDAQRNWEMIKAILSNPEPGFTPTNIFISNHLKAAVLAAAGNDPLRGKAAGLMSYWPGHENHLHLRVQ